MTASLSATDRALLDAVNRVDVMDAAGKLIANPRRAMVSLAGQIAMAVAVERLQAVAIEAELLARAINTLPDHELDGARSPAAFGVWMRVIALNEALAAARGETNHVQPEQETEHDQ